MICLAFISCFDNGLHAQQSARKVSIDVTKVLGGQHICIVGNGSVQFINENELVLLAGPDSNCYMSVQALQLVVITRDGRVLTQKSWPSTYPFVVLSADRIAISGNGDITILNDALKAVQTVSLPKAQHSSVSLQKEAPDTLLARLPRGEVLAYSGLPLVQTSQQETKQGDQVVYLRRNREMLILRKQELLKITPSGDSRQLANLTWLHDCNKLCQAWSSGTTWAVSEDGNRAVFTSSGTRFPVTDESGLFPFFRLLVVDLATGKELYRKEFDTKTSGRSAQLSPTGDSLLINDGDQLHFQPVN